MATLPTYTWTWTHPTDSPSTWCRHLELPIVPLLFFPTTSGASVKVSRLTTIRTIIIGRGWWILWQMPWRWYDLYHMIRECKWNVCLLNCFQFVWPPRLIFTKSNWWWQWKSYWVLRHWWPHSQSGWYKQERIFILAICHEGQSASALLFRFGRAPWSSTTGSGIGSHDRSRTSSKKYGIWWIVLGREKYQWTGLADVF